MNTFDHTSKGLDTPQRLRAALQSDRAGEYGAVAPSLTAAPVTDSLLSPPAKRAAAAKRHPLAPIGHPDDIAGAVCFLLTDDSSWVTRPVLQVDGRLSRIRWLT